MASFSQTFWGALAVTIVGGVAVVAIQKYMFEGSNGGSGVQRKAPDLIYNVAGVHSDTAVLCLNGRRDDIVADNDTGHFLTFYFHDVESMEPLFSLKPHERTLISRDHIEKVIRYKHDGAPLEAGSSYEFKTLDGKTSATFYVNGDC